MITGAGSGIGRATAVAFAEAGALVHVVDLNETKAAQVVGELKLMGSQAWAHQADVREADALQRVAQEVYSRHGRTDILVNNAGVANAGRLEQTSLEDWKWILDTNVWGVIHGVHAFVPRMIKQPGDAHIVNTASVAGLIGLPSMAPYCTSKFAVVGLSESLGVELARHGISVSAICPGIVDTNILRAGKWGETLAASKPALMDLYRKRGISPESIARDILRAVKRSRPLQVSAGAVYPALLLKRLSPRLFRSAAAFAAGRLFNGAQR